MSCFLWGSHGGVAPLLWGQSPQPCWPLCLLAVALIHQRLLPTEQQVCDYVTRLFVGRVSVITTVIGSSYPLSLIPFRSSIGQACQVEETEQEIMGWVWQHHSWQKILQNFSQKLFFSCHKFSVKCMNFYLRLDLCFCTALQCVIM